MIQVGQVWERRGIEREVILIESGWPNQRMIVSREARPGDSGRIVRSFESQFERWARHAVMARDGDELLQRDRQTEGGMAPRTDRAESDIAGGGR